VNWRDTELKKVTPEEIDQFEQILEPLFIFSLVWSVGCTVDYDGRKNFNVFLRDLMKSSGSAVSIPEMGSVYDFNFDRQKKGWVAWTDTVRAQEIDPKLSYSDIVIQTNDYLRMLYMMKILLTNGKHVMCPGPTGTGKSLNASTLLSTGLTEDYQYISLTFSAQTSANQTQDTIDSKMDKRRKGVYGPPPSKKCIIFVDDLNMPKREQYGAQPPIEILRQYLDHSVRKILLNMFYHIYLL
jgi:dynein heavy chain